MKRSLFTFFVVTVFLTACGARPAGPAAASTAPALPAASTDTGAPVAASTEAPAASATLPPAASTEATSTPAAPPAPVAIGLDNITQLVQLHDFVPDIEALTNLNPGDYGLAKPILSPDGKSFAVPVRIFAGDGKYEMLILDLATGAQISSFTLDGVTKLFGYAFSPDGKSLVYSSYPDGKIIVRDLAGQKVDRVLWSGKAQEVISDITFTADGKQVFAITGSGSSGGAGDSLMVWDYASGTLVTQLPADTQYAVDICRLSADGSRLIISDRSGGSELAVYDTSTWKRVASITPSASAAEVAAISPDGKLVATSKEQGGNILIWDAAAGKLLSKLDSPFVDTASIEFSPDGSMLVVSGTPSFEPQTDNMYLDAGIWDTSSWKQTGVQHWGKAISLTFSRDGRYILEKGSYFLYLIGLPDQGFQAPQQAVVDFTSALSRADYKAAASLFFFPDYLRDNLKSQGLINDPAAVLEAICTRKALPCLPAKVVYSARDADQYRFLVQFTKADGSVYADANGATLFEVAADTAADGSALVDLYNLDLASVLKK